MAISNPNRIVTIARLSEFLASVKSWVNTTFYSKESADAKYALKNGSADEGFTASSLNVVTPGVTSGSTVNAALSVSGNTYPNSALVITHSNGRSVSIPIKDEDLVTGVNGFSTSGSVAVFYNLSVAENQTASFDSASNQVSNINNAHNTVVFVGTGEIVGLQQGFYLVDVNGLITKLLYIYAPSRNAIYYNKTTSSLCYWTGSVFETISGGSSGTIIIDGDEYEIADPSDIDDMFTNS